MDRKEELLEQVVEHVLEHGLIGLTLRPLAAAIGTSDRMLIYHFGGRDELVAAVVARTNELSVAAIGALAPAEDVRGGVEALWRAYRAEPLHSCLQIYLQAAATGLIGMEPYRSVVRETNELWYAALRGYITACGAPPERAGRIATLVDSSLFGFHLDLAVDRPDEVAAGVADLAAAAGAIAEDRIHSII
ncbi:TetR/AcrR family transcriptional regulator [Nocardioides albus]|uniref:AcrR family transcriptional regulator n=1 Tax=Nocardioides albus TaxID=1841 RepID=A0A7W5F9T8_9ACTN|nr:TetR/AcrR family transcriptional regulator [Nocardioides albus]MBB3090401.1 AcrR family transcriptional regulator [Nocardioides albus]